MAVSIKDVAKKAGVSTATVSYVINGSTLIKEETAELVRAAIEELDYVPNSIARSLRKKDSRLIAYIIPDISNPFFSKIAKTIEDILRENGDHLILCNTYENEKTERDMITMLKAQQVYGYIIAPASITFDYRTILPENEYQLVFFDRKSGVFNADMILEDDNATVPTSVSEFVKKGHRRIAFIGNVPNISTTMERLVSYKESLEANGIEIDESLIKLRDSNEKSGYSMMEEILDNTDATAVIISNMPLTLSAMQCIRDRGISIPDEMAVIGYDDYKWSSAMNPPLSTISQRTEEMGKKIAECLLARIKGYDGEYEEYRIPSKLTIRSSF